MNAPELTVVIGANGAGKTTWCREHRDALPKPFYNADSTTTQTPSLKAWATGTKTPNYSKCLPP